MSITNQQYDQMVKSTSPPSKSFKNIPIAFLVGGVICTIGQVILKVFERYNFDKVSASTWVSIILILTSAVLTGFGLYEKLAKHAGAGTLVPITGFANSVVHLPLSVKLKVSCLRWGKDFHHCWTCNTIRRCCIYHLRTHLLSVFIKILDKAVQTITVPL